MTQRIRTSLDRTPSAPSSADELKEMRKRAWLKQGMPSFDLKDINDAWTRQVIINEANRQYGKRDE